jgi:D-alanine-D-alanine ligase
MVKDKTKVVVIYGGRSTEHEISCRSVRYLFNNLDRAKYDVYALAIDKQGRWLRQDVGQIMAQGHGPVAIHSPPGVEIKFSGTSTIDNPGQPFLFHILGFDDGELKKDQVVVFPMLHGTFGEDGSIQGFFDLGELAYVGASTLGSAVAMDKVVAKKLVAASDVPIVPYVSVRQHQWEKNSSEVVASVLETLGETIFVKPASLGSSVGVSKAVGREALIEACQSAFSFDEKILLEKAMDVREIECAVMGSYEPEVSQPGEVVTTNTYSYEAKYLDANAAKVQIPAELPPGKVAEVRGLAHTCFQALELYGLARIDFFLERSTNKFYFNEANTMPGFTEISQFPQLWQHMGLTPSEILDRLIDLAIVRRKTLDRLSRSL